MNSLLVLLFVLNFYVGEALSHNDTPRKVSRDDNGNSTREKRQTEGCILPQFPENGRWVILNGQKQPGDLVEKSTAIRFECFRGFKLTIPDVVNVPAYIVCDGDWSGTFPKCHRLCPPLFSTPTTILTCRDKEGYKISCSEATNGTQLTYQCIDNEIYEGNTRQKVFYCEDGLWDNTKPECQPVCGKKNVNAKPLSIGSENTKLYEFPWVAAVYLKVNTTLRNNCGGTLITPRIVLTAAHCVSRKGLPLPHDEVEIAAGKQYLEYADERDEKAQYRKVSSIILNSEYKVERSYQYDIALLVADKSFNLGPEVQPACYDDIPLPRVGAIGEIAGWGGTEDGVQSDQLKTLHIPYKEQTSCAQELPADFVNKYYFHDKICAGFFQQNKSVCKGDSGSGLVYINPQDNRYYVHGVVSIAPQSRDSTCNSQDNTLLTKVSVYYSWIERESNIIERCTLPPYPQNGKWELENGIKKMPGDTIQSPITLLSFSCNPGYILDSADSRYYCASSRFPNCKMVCPLLYFSTDAFIECVDETNQKIVCSEAAQGAIMTFTCPRKNGEQQSGSIHCNQGSWNGPQPECITKNPQGPPKGTPKPPVIVTTAPTIPDMKVICTYDAQWYPNHKVIPEDFDPNLCTHLVYSSMGLWTKGDVKVRNDSLEIDEEGKIGLYHRVADMKLKNPNLKILFSVGGSAVTDYNLFRRLVGAVGRTLGFLGSAGYFINTYKFDGLNIDWDSPKEAEKERLNVFLERVREDFDKHGWLLTASVRPDFSGTGYDIPKMNKLLDWVTVKSYDLYDPDTTYTGIHNALSASSKDNEDEKAHRNMHAIANNWLAAGLSKEKLVLSIAFHGRLLILTDDDNHSLRSPIIGPGPNKGFLRYYEICSKYGGYVKVWDDEQKSPYKYKNKEWFSYNDEKAVKKRAAYVKSKGFKGVNVWPIDGDDVRGKCGTKQVLLKAVHEGLGGT
ncbi:unnamed protein product [Phaedon cochleariae]|uniref:Chitinase n=1 Tax=Phaedon cochleariae TaxID=80249 RepID=A0A9N9SCV2_PHACE|nr:unnamed protein product [Phaedon cochleariae]